MPRRLRRKWLVLGVTIPIAIGSIALGIYFLVWERKSHEETRQHAKPEAPPDLQKLRNTYAAGLEAVQRGDGVDAVKQFSSFTFHDRAVEEYRLYYLAVGQQLMHDAKRARLTLALLEARQPAFVFADDAGLTLAGLYGGVADWRHTAGQYAAVASRTDSPAVAAAARWGEVESRFFSGDVAASIAAARQIAIKSPRSSQAASALALLRGIDGTGPDGMVPFSPAERLERAVSLLRDGDPQSAFGELSALEPLAPSSIRDAVRLNEGLALNSLHRYEDSNKILDMLASGPFRIAIPAIYTASKNYRAIAASINPIVIKTIVQRKQVGKRKVTVGKGEKRRTIIRLRFANVKKNVQLVDLAKKAKKDEADRLATERLKDLLQIETVAPEVRLEVLKTLIAITDAKNQDAYEQELVGEVVKIDPYADPALQHFWDKAWAAYSRGDLNGAKPLFRFIADTYGNPNVKRQAEYWYARTIERLGAKEESAAIYRRLASAPYEDIYSVHSVGRGAPRGVATTNPLKMNRPDWRDIAEQTMPGGLRLAYELTALNDMRDAQLEIRKNAGFVNRHFTNALLADLYNSAGNADLTYRTIRAAFPQLATVEQDAVPPYFLKIYYPVRYEDAILKDSRRFDVDPYLVMALILQESYFNPKAKSRVGATGLMQLMPGTGKELGQKLHGRFSITRLNDPDTNIELGTYHLRHMIQIFAGHVPLAVASYNAGQGNVLKWRRAAASKPMDEFLESIPFPETRNYVKRVTLLRSSYARIAQ